MRCGLFVAMLGRFRLGFRGKGREGPDLGNAVRLIVGFRVELGETEIEERYDLQMHFFLDPR